MKYKSLVLILFAGLTSSLHAQSTGPVIKGKVYGGGELALVEHADAEGKPATDITINNGEIYGHVYGGGKGVHVDSKDTIPTDKTYRDIAKVIGHTSVTLNGGTLWRNIYGGGAFSLVSKSTPDGDGNTFGGNTSVSIKSGWFAGDVFGGGEGDIRLNSDQTYKRGSDGKLIITSADIEGNTNVNISGGNAIWDRTSVTSELTVDKFCYEKVVDAEGDKKIVLEMESFTEIPADKLDGFEWKRTEKEKTPAGEIVMWNPSESSTFKGTDSATGLTINNSLFYDDTNKRFLIQHNIYGGGYVACNVAGEASVDMTTGLGDRELTKTKQWKNAFDDDANPHFYAFGGGYGAYTTVASTKVNVNVEDYDETLDADTDQQLARPRRAMPTPDDDDMGIYNNEYGIANATVLGVLGGAYAGFVKGNTNVTIGGKTFIRRVYGGGFGQLEAYNKLAATDYINLGTTDASLNKTREDLGMVGGNTDVKISGARIYGDVFGGGAGVESTYLDLDETVYKELDEEHTTATKDFTMGEVKGYTQVNISKAARIYGNLYGGGDVANVINDADEDDALDNIFATKLDIKGGKIYGKVFGGGSGREAAKVKAHTNNEIAVGKVNGDTNVELSTEIVADADEATLLNKIMGYKDDEPNLFVAGGTIAPSVYGDIYGGGAFGVVTGSTYVTVGEGKIGIGDNIFGGGLGHVSEDYSKITSANVKGNSIVTINGGFALWNEYSDEKGNMRKWLADEYSARNKNITDADPLFYDAANKRFVKDHNVYGGGNVACVVGTEGNNDIFTAKGGEGTDKDYLEDYTNLNEYIRATLKPGDYKTGNTVVMMNESHISDPLLFKNYNDWSETPDWSLAAKCWIATLEEQREPQFSVFGAGKGLLTHTVHDAQARVEVLAVKYSDPEKTQYLWVDPDDKSKGPVEHWTPGWDYEYEHMLEWDDAMLTGQKGDIKNDLANFYPNEYKKINYVDAERRLRTAAFAKQIGVAGNTVMQVIGGGYNGSVGRNTFCSAESRAIVGKMFGGGFGSFEAWQEAQSIDKTQSIDNGTPNYINKVGTVGGTATLNIDRGSLVWGDAFGGGAGVESRKIGDDDTYTDFPEIATVNRTHVKLGAVGASEKYDFVVPVIYGSLYGGGDVAIVKERALSELSRGQVMSYFFGGGNGRLNINCNDYTILGSVGAAEVHYIAKRKKADGTTDYSKSYGGTTQTYAHEPIIWQRAYGGGRNGLVKGGYTETDVNAVKPGDTKVVIDGGQFGHNIFGGGWGAVTDKDGKVLTDDNGVVDDNYEEKDIFLTSADIMGNTHIIVNAGTVNVDQMWDTEKREWKRANIDEENDIQYSPQYDYKNTWFTIKHNIYSGGNRACNIGMKYKDGNAIPSGKAVGDLIAGTGNTYVTVNRGMIDRQFFEKDGNMFLGSNEWKQVYEKHGSPFFCVFGAGYGERTSVYGDTNIKIDMKDDSNTANGGLGVGLISPVEEDKHHNHGGGGSETCEHDRLTMNHTKFPDAQSIMDIVGGGYNGSVEGTCRILVDGNPFIRNIFGGAYYATVGATDIKVLSGNIDNIYGGGMMGDVHNGVNVTVGTETGRLDESTASHLTSEKDENARLLILGSVYGGNDVSGVVGAWDNGGNIAVTQGEGTGVNVRLLGGHIKGNVYGGGNGDYLYMIDQSVSRVTADERHKVGEKEKLVYRVPIRSDDFPSLAAMSDAQRVVNISTFRPVVLKTKIDFKGNSGTEETLANGKQYTDRLLVDGSIFGGGSSATISNFTGNADDSYVKLNAGSHIRVGRVFLGSDGDALFNTAGDNNFIEDFPNLNGITLAKTIDWENDPANVSIPIKYLSVPNEQRSLVYKNVLDLYYMPVELNFMPEMTWNGKNNCVNVAKASAEEGYEAYTELADNESGFTDAIIGTFCCGGNRGNMNTDTKFHLNFPAGLTITGDIIGGCNNSNDEKTDAEGNKLSHEGGFLLGEHKVETGSVKRTPQIHLTMRNKFHTDKTTTGLYPQSNNVYGGCYTSGTVRGDILVDLRSNMLASLDSVALRRTTDEGITVASVYGAGYGDKTWVYGDTEVRLGEETACSYEAGNVMNPAEAYNKSTNLTPGANYIFGGGRQGNVVGNTTVRILNGRVGGCVVGASYAGVLFGSAQTMLGYPEVYYIANENGEYDLKRADLSQAHLDYVDDKGNKVIKQKIRYTKGDFVSKAVYDEIIWPDGTTVEQKAAKFSELHSVPKDNDWSKVNILIDKAIYGGGYALAGSSVGSGAYTVRKYIEDETGRFIDDVVKETYGFDEPNEIIGYGGNTFVMVGDVTGDYDTQAKTSSTHVADDEKNRDHIGISSSSLEEVNVKTGEDLFGLYYRQTNSEANPDYSGSKPDAPTGPFILRTYESKKADVDVHKYYKYVGEGGIYGDGHLSVSEGFRVSDAMGYGYGGATPSNPKLMNCIHRFDIARFKDCCVSLLGDRDYASADGAISSTAYSIARVTEVKMESSIDPTSNYKAKSEKHSRNYIGLSNAQFELGAIESNDLFAPTDKGGAKYHNKEGVLISTDMEIEGSENESNERKKFDKVLSYYDVKKWYLNDHQIKDENSGYYDNANAKVLSEKQFQLRNSATARNMFGIFSGYALNVIYNRYDPIQGKTVQYYGPIKGVFEVDLIGTRAGEAGGYAYAQNIHTEKVGGEGEHKDEHTFLETSGNFVFPATEYRKVIDDCYPVGYTASSRDHAEGHYWYVTGFKYFYNATITGYTYDNGIRKFDMENTARMIFMPGAKAGQPVTLKDFHFLQRHSVDNTDPDNPVTFPCDIEAKLLTKTGNESDWNATVAANNATTNPYYNLSLAVSNSDVLPENYTSTYTYDEYKALPGKESTTDEQFNALSDVEKRKVVPHVNYMDECVLGTNEFTGLNIGNLTATGENVDNVIAIRLTDLVQNNGKVGDATYFEKYLSEPCVANITLTTPLVDENGNHLYTAYQGIETSQIDSSGDIFFVQNDNNDYVRITKEAAQETTKQLFIPKPAGYAKVASGSPYNGNTTYYTSESGGDGNKWAGTAEQFDKMVAGSGLWIHQPAAEEQEYEYNITLTINYIKGPGYEGKVTVQNCALPGEAIRLSSSSITVTSDIYSMPQNGSFWTIGPGKKVTDEKGYHWELVDAKGTKSHQETIGDRTVTIYDLDPDTRNFYYPYNPNVTNKEDKSFDKINPMWKKGTKTTGITKDDLRVWINDNNQDFYIPAYYFQNGYVVQYSFTVDGVDDVFDVLITPDDTLCIHNYHRMDPTLGTTRNKVETHIREAVTERTKRPDGWTGTDADWQNVHRKPRVYIAECSSTEYSTYDVFDLKAFANYLTAANEYGKDVEFYLMDDFTLPSNWTAPANFKGTLHGNGHVLKGLGSNKSLFSAISDDAHIYNLGLPTGKIVATEVPARYSCCYTRDNNTVYRKDGSAVTTYTEDDWRYGRVAYDLNQYYLDERLDRSDDTDTHNHGGYVEGIYADGDYQYARTNINGEEYLRTNAIPHYIINDYTALPSALDNITYHNRLHTKDAWRAYSEGTPTPAFMEYRPLFEEAHLKDNGSEATVKKNDYLFFGQYLNDASTQQAIPSALVNTQRNVSSMLNRVWRAYGFYHSKEDNAFHFNYDAYAMNPELTAIDFTGLHDSKYNWQVESLAPTASSDDNPSGNAAIYYPKMMDMPAKLSSFKVTNKVTKNLLVYTDKQSENVSANAVNAALKYSQTTPEKNILGHQILETETSGSYSTALLHLVERRPGNDEYSNDFNAPIPFTVTQRAWYERIPMYYRSLNSRADYNNPSAWEGICLPFTVNKVSANVNGEMTHFYGPAFTGDDPKENTNTLHHEYWLTGMISAENDQATFARPSKDGNDLFTESSQENGTYSFNNPFFTNLKDYSHSDADWYATSHEFADYVYLTHAVPYIISVPGVDFYEFDLSGEFYKNYIDKYGVVAGKDRQTMSSPQIVTFENPSATINISDDESKTTAVSTKSHIGTYMETNDVLGMDDEGKAFDVTTPTVVPFRTYMSVSNGAKPRRIVIVTDSEKPGDSEFGMEAEEDDEEDINPGAPSISIVIKDLDVTVTSTYNETRNLNVFAIGGQLVYKHTAPTGNSTFRLPYKGFFIIGGRKVHAK